MRGVLGAWVHHKRSPSVAIPDWLRRVLWGVPVVALLCLAYVLARAA